jgi:uncharacterized protein
LFLSVAAHANQQEFLPVYDWFRNGLGVPFDGRSNSWMRKLVRRLRKSEAEKRTVIELLRLVDLGILDVVVTESSSAPLVIRWEDFGDSMREEFLRATERLVESPAVFEFKTHRVSEPGSPEAVEPEKRMTLLFRQGRHGQLLELGDQSEGTIAWMRLLVDALEALEMGSLLIIDEIDTSLHPRLTARLIELFQDARTNPRSAQLVFATHDVSLLGTSFGRDVLARDQIWFVEKDADGATTLFPLTDFHPRKEENTERRYLGGSYGAVPAVFSDSLVDGYLAGRRESLNDSA